MPEAGVENKLGVEVVAPNKLGLVVLPNKLEGCCVCPKVDPNAGVDAGAPKVVPGHYQSLIKLNAHF